MKLDDVFRSWKKLAYLMGELKKHGDVSCLKEEEWLNETICDLNGITWHTSETFLAETCCDKTIL